MPTSKMNVVCGPNHDGSLEWSFREGQGSIARTNEVSNVLPKEIVDEVRAILEQAARGKSPTTKYLTAYQILDRLPSDRYDQLVNQRGRGGKGEGVYYAATSVVAKAAEMVCNDSDGDIDYIDTGGLKVEIKDQIVEPSYEVCGLYRLPA